jgi:hypothetical protein
MAQEFTIKSTAIEDKINQLLPSQGGFQPGVDFSASTMVIPVVDLTETAEGSNVRPDLQTALSLSSATAFLVENTTSTLVNTTGYFRVFGSVALEGSVSASFNVTDGVTTKKLIDFKSYGSQFTTETYDFIVFLPAGDSLTATSSSAVASLRGSTRQIADINGTLINP